MVAYTFPLFIALAAAAPSKPAESCLPGVYMDILDRFPTKASSLCSEYESKHAPTPLPSWLNAEGIDESDAKSISSACQCFLQSSTAITKSTLSVSQSATLSSSAVTAASTSVSVYSTASTASATSTNSGPSSSRTSPPIGAIVVDQSGINSQYTTVQEGVNALNTTMTGEQYLFIYPGVYNEQVYIPSVPSNLTVYGYTHDTASYQGNTVNITYDLALENTTSDDLTATVRAWSENFKMYNINILNTFGHIPEDGQNLALSAHVTNQGYYGCGLYGYQDTLLANTGTQLYAKSLIVGAVDFIFGQTAQAWFDQIDIRTIAAGCVTASGRAENNTSWYVINNSSVMGINSTVDAEAGLNYLGRPWGAFARVTFQETYLSDVIAPAGWSVWSTSNNDNDTRISNVTFSEYQNYGPGSFPTEGPRANFSEQLTSPVLIENILGLGYADEWWVDLSYLD